MTSTLAAALALASQGFQVFPLIEREKVPAIAAFPELASSDPDRIRGWWVDPVLELELSLNVGISTTAFNCGSSALVVVDVDEKSGRSGGSTLLEMELKGLDFPDTYTQSTPTGGRHLVYRCPTPLRQGANVLGPGLDIRSKGGYIVGAGSVVSAGTYAVERDGPLVDAPAWLVKLLERPPRQGEANGIPSGDVHSDLARVRAIDLLIRRPPAIEGGRNEEAYRAACAVKDLGVTREDVPDLLRDYWSCEPALTDEELAAVVKSAYRYGSSAPGCAAPEAQFEAAPPPAPGEDPVGVLNRDHALVVIGGGVRVLWETTGPRGETRLEHLSVDAFHTLKAPVKLLSGDGKSFAVSRLWMSSPVRRTYDGFSFCPGRKPRAGYYELWRGFAVQPCEDPAKASREARASVDAWRGHLQENVCRGDAVLARWVEGYFAHLIQRPGVKPLVALVLRGGKGTGKNALVDRVGALLGPNHYMVCSNKRYLVGNFNSHLETLLLLVLDEAFWSGDKQSEGILKDLVTGTRYVIERKGVEPYTCENLARVAILGNEDWIVPSTQDERRFAVLDVGEGRKQDRVFFRRMREGMERGGYGVLLRHLLDFDLSGVDIDEAPSTQALLEQKLASLEPVHQWWRDSLEDGRILGSDLFDVWPSSMETELFRGAYRKYCTDRRIFSRQTDHGSMGRSLRKVCPSLEKVFRRIEGNLRRATYYLPPLETAREEWSRFIGHTVEWGVEDE